MRRFRLGTGLLALLATGCTQLSAGPNDAAQKPIPVADLARAAEKELGAMLEVLNSDRATRKALGTVNTSLVKSGLARGLPNLPTPEDAEACFRDAAASRGLQVTTVKSTVPELTPPAELHLKPGERWRLTGQDLMGMISMAVVIDGPLPSIATLIDEVGRCKRLVAVRTAKVVGSSVTITADAWFERNVATPELDLRWRSLDERLTAAGWKLNDPTLAQDAEYGRLKAAVDLGREQLPRVRSLMKTSVELPRWITRARELLTLKQEVMQIQGAKLLGLNQG